MIQRRLIRQLRRSVDLPTRRKKPTVRNVRAAAVAAAGDDEAVMRMRRAAELKPRLRVELPMTMSRPGSHLRLAMPRPTNWPEQERLVRSQFVAVAAAVAAVPERPPLRAVRQRRNGRVVQPMSRQARAGGQQKALVVVSRAVAETQMVAVVAGRAPFPVWGKAVMRTTKALSSWAWTRAGLIRLGPGLRAMRNCLPKVASTVSAMSPAGSRQSGS